MSNPPDIETFAAAPPDPGVGRRAARNTAAMGLGRIITFALNVIATVILTRYLGPTSYGHFATIFALITLIDYTADIGLGDVAVRELARNPAQTNKLLTAATVLRLGFAAVGIVLTGILPLVLNYPPELRGLAVLASATLIIRALSSPTLVFRARLNMHYDVIVLTVMRLADTGLILLVALLGGGLREMILARLAAGLIGAVAYWGVAQRTQRLGLKFDKAAMKRMGLDALPVAMSAVMLMIYLRADLLMLAKMLGPNAVGLYSATHQILEYNLAISGLFMGSLFPLLAQYYHQHTHYQFIALYQKSFDLLMMVIIPMAVVTTLFAEDLVTLLFGPSYAGAAMSLRIMLWTSVAFFFGNVVGATLIAINWQRLQVVTDSVGAGLNIALNFWLIPIWGITGSAVAILITALFAALVGHEIIRRKTGVALRLRTLSRIGLASALLAGVALIAGKSQLLSGWLLGTICGCVVYLLALFVLRVIRLDELRMFLPSRRVAAE
ncbi:MAG: flippase [Chloroflexi bacterium]|nr:flippase [Chloroflexota bacterium]